MRHDQPMKHEFPMASEEASYPHRSEEAEHDAIEQVDVLQELKPLDRPANRPSAFAWDVQGLATRSVKGSVPRASSA